jgi:threonine aldolase
MAMQFGSDNQTGASQQVLDAIAAANAGHAHGYGDDEWTARAVAALRDTFDYDLEAYFVPTGTAANCLALASMVRPWQVVLCHTQAHVIMDESTAPELFTGGARVLGLGRGEGKLTAGTLRRYLEHAGHEVPHNPSPGALSIAQSNESGLVYTQDEIAALAEYAHADGMTLHMDGARFSNALVARACSPAELTWKAGVDILTLGASKNGCLAAEAVLCFNGELASGFAHRRKRTGHLLSKGRFFGSQFIGWLENGHWLELARRANDHAAELAGRIAAVPGVELVWPTEANEVFITMPRALANSLQADGAEFYEWYVDGLPDGVVLGPQDVFVRLVCSFATTDAHVEEFVSRAAEMSRG